MAVSPIESCFHLSSFASSEDHGAEDCTSVLMCNFFLQLQAGESKAMRCSLSGSDGSGTNGEKNRSEATKANVPYLNSRLEDSPSRDSVSLQHKVNLQSFPSHYVALSCSPIGEFVILLGGASPVCAVSKQYMPPALGQHWVDAFTYQVLRTLACLQEREGSLDTSPSGLATGMKEDGAMAYQADAEGEGSGSAPAGTTRSSLTFEAGCEILCTE